MTTTTLAPQFQPSTIEAQTYQRWLDAGVFTAGTRDASPYVIVIPPPNVTAVLHMGHGLNNTIQDVLIRTERMRGRDTLWLPGTDHAGIATQNVVERILAQEGVSRHDLGREKFVERVWDHVRQTGSLILDQLKAIGASCDWSRTRFTLDEGLSRAVVEVFVSLYEKGLIYRGKYIINWCPRCRTALSNEEAEKEERDGHLWHIRYPIDGGDGEYIEVATTRPETMLGDTAVAVHPADERYTDLVGRVVRLPLTDRVIPILADDAVERDFGTGAVKVTPAHDPLDFEIGGRHGLPQIDVMTPDARISGNAPERFQGLDRFEARRRVVAELEARGLLRAVEPHRHAVGQCYRCDTIIEPRLSDQWFVSMKPLAEPALEAYRSGRVRFVPRRRGDDYERWMVNIRDWCISRQLWWGHRIPAWYCRNEECNHITVARETPAACGKCGGAVRQDEDVLDTWFSSWLWPFSTLGWPEQTDDLKRYYPGNTLVTSPDILFFWVARMIMSGIEFMGDIPFDTVYLHGVVRDTQHRKMSKSLGNGIDPLDVVERYGADALRYTVVAGSAIGTDVILDPENLDSSFAAGRNFANKLWNVGRLILGQLNGRPAELDPAGMTGLELADRWILSRTRHAIHDVSSAVDRYRLNDAANAVYHFVWDELADWYLEQVKPRLYGSGAGRDTAAGVLHYVLGTSLKLLHPIMPFITEELWQHLPGAEPAMLAVAPWPVADETFNDPAAEREFAQVQRLVSAVRNVRAEYGIKPGRSVPVWVEPASEEVRRVFESEDDTIKRLARISELTFGDPTAGAGAHQVLADGSTVFVPLDDAIDIERECARIGRERDRLSNQLRQVRNKLANEKFVNRAPPEVVAREKEKEETWQEQLEAIEEKLRALGC